MSDFIAILFLPEMAMYAVQIVLSQVMTYLHVKAFSRMVASLRVKEKVQDFNCLDPFPVLAFAQLITRES